LKLKKSAKMKKIKIYNYILVLFSFISSTQASTSNTDDLPFNYDEFESRIVTTYAMSTNLYHQSILEHLSTVQAFLEERENMPSTKPLGIIVGETHTRTGHQCLEMALLNLASCYNIRTLLMEYAPKYFQENVLQGYGHIDSKAIVTEADSLDFTIVPADMERDTSKKFLAIKNPTVDDIADHYEVTFNRDLHMAQEILKQEENFLFYVGQNHLGPIYYNAELNEKFDLIFLKCSPSPYVEKRHLAYQIFEDDEICCHFQQTIDFKKETKNCYATPIFYNEDTSQTYRMIKKITGKSSGFCEEELRPIVEE
jgi:hypothetical protein